MDAEGARTTDFEKYGENTEVRCKLCGEKYPYNHIESHVVGVHGLDGPKEMYIDDQSSLVRSVSGTQDSNQAGENQGYWRNEPEKKLPHLIIVPTNSSINKWEQEFSKWFPDDFKVLSYYGSKDHRRNLRQKIQKHVGVEYDVILTTIAMIIGRPDDRKIFSNLNFHYVIFAQGRGKWDVKTFINLMQIQASKRLLLTATDPMQYENLVEIMPLLYYCSPENFDGKINLLTNISSMYPSPRANEKDVGFVEDELVKSAKAIVKPFLLRRLKSDVKNELRHFPDFPLSVDEACKFFGLNNANLDYNKLVSYVLFKETYQFEIREENPEISYDDLEILMKAKWREFKESGTCGGSGRFSKSSLNKDGGEYLHIIWIISI